MVNCDSYQWDTSNCTEKYKYMFVDIKRTTGNTDGKQDVKAEPMREWAIFPLLIKWHTSGKQDNKVEPTRELMDYEQSDNKTWDFYC